MGVEGSGNRILAVARFFQSVLGIRKTPVISFSIEN
jgi:hypothetical protein